jgi:transglutaminase-like putative cysteine protease
VYYLIRHVTRYDYAEPIRENTMELRLQPRSDGRQRSLSFELDVQPAARMFSYRDYLGNVIHHFDVATSHSELVIRSEALVETLPGVRFPHALSADAWGELEEIVETEDYWEMLLPSRFARPTERLHEMIEACDLARRDEDPLSYIRRVGQSVYEWFEYAPSSTRVDSPIDEALETRRGVCQDFAHVMIAVLRQMRVPARYVSGYLYHREVGEAGIVDDATHAWVEALLPEIGWVGFDPTADSFCSTRHVRTAIGRDYADVPPTRGVYRGETDSLLSVSVKVWPWGAGLSTTEPEAPRPPAALAMQQRAAQQQTSTDQ